VKEKHGRGWTARICRGGWSVGKPGLCATRKVGGGKRGRVGSVHTTTVQTGRVFGRRANRTRCPAGLGPGDGERQGPGGTNDVEVVGLAWRRRGGEVTAGAGLNVTAVSTFRSSYEGERWSQVEAQSRKRRRKVDDGSGRRGRCRLEVPWVSEG
jgi:hypothetical protein